MLTPFAVRLAFRKRWTASPLATLISGGLHFGRAPQNVGGVAVVFPYATFDVKELQAEVTSGDAVQKFAIAVVIWGKVGAPTETPACEAAAAELKRLFDWPKTLPLLLGAKTLGILRQPQTLELDTTRRNASDVEKCGGQWEWWFQAPRRP